MKTLGDIAEYLEASLKGDPSIEITGLATIKGAREGQITFLANPLYLNALEQCMASAVILSPEMAEHCQVSTLILDDPYLGFAKISHSFDTSPHYQPGIHPAAVIADSASVADSAYIGPNVVVEENVIIKEGVVVQANCFIGAGVTIGENSRLWANVTIYHGVTIGRRTIIHSGSIIGADGFGFANAEGRWHKIAQTGSVKIGDDVDIGASTTIDRGAIEDTVIGNGVIIDNQIQIAHNVCIGDYTAIAGNAGIAGSTSIGSRCLISGGSTINGHIEIVDDVQVSFDTTVSKSIKQSGVYSSGTGFSEHGIWRRNVARFKQLDKIAKRLKLLEKKMSEE